MTESEERPKLCLFTFMGTGARFVRIGYKGRMLSQGHKARKMIRHFRNVCLGAFLVGASVYQGGVTGFILAAIGIALIIQSRALMK